MSEKLRADLQSPNYEEVNMARFIYIDLPPEDKHVGHIMGDVSCKLFSHRTYMYFQHIQGIKIIFCYRDGCLFTEKFDIILILIMNI